MACRILVSDQRWNLGPRQWKCQVLTTETTRGFLRIYYHVSEQQWAQSTISFIFALLVSRAVSRTEQGLNKSASYVEIAVESWPPRSLGSPKCQSCVSNSLGLVTPPKLWTVMRLERNHNVVVSEAEKVRIYEQHGEARTWTWRSVRSMDTQTQRAEDGVRIWFHQIFSTETAFSTPIFP